MHLGPSTFFIWAFVLILQNFAFTFVSRARNSGSLRRHMIASIFSNGVWFLSQIIIFEQMYKVMKGDYGLFMAIFVGLYYTVFTMTGSLIAHYWALKNEKGKARIGAYKDVATFTKAEGDELRSMVSEWKKGFNITVTGFDPTVIPPPMPSQGEKYINGGCTN